MMIVEKAPYTAPRLIYVDSRRYSDLTDELNLRLVMHSIGRGYYLLIQSKHVSDEPNFTFEDTEIYGKSYVIKAGKDKMIEMTDQDLLEAKSLLNI